MIISTKEIFCGIQQIQISENLKIQDVFAYAEVIYALFSSIKYIIIMFEAILTRLQCTYN